MREGRVRRHLRAEPRAVHQPSGAGFRNPSWSRCQNEKRTKSFFGCDNPAVLSNAVRTMSSGHRDKSQVPETEKLQVTRKC